MCRFCDTVITLHYYLGLMFSKLYFLVMLCVDGILRISLVCRYCGSGQTHAGNGKLFSHAVDSIAIKD